MNKLSIDIETYSGTPITAGVYRYVEDSDFEILLFGYSADDSGYKEQSDSVALFLDEKCDTSDPNAVCPSGELYTKYRNYCFQVGEPARSTTDFYAILKKRGFKRIDMKHRYFIKGLSLLPIDLSSASEDFGDLLK